MSGDYKDEDAFNNRGIVRYLLKDYDAALEDFTQASKISPYGGHIYLNRANAYMLLNELEKAEKDLTLGNLLAFFCPDF